MCGRGASASCQPARRESKQTGWGAKSELLDAGSWTHAGVSGTRLAVVPLRADGALAWHLGGPYATHYRRRERTCSSEAAHASKSGLTTLTQNMCTIEAWKKLSSDRDKRSGETNSVPGREPDRPSEQWRSRTFTSGCGNAIAPLSRWRVPLRTTNTEGSRWIRTVQHTKSQVWRAEQRRRTDRRDPMLSTSIDSRQSTCCPLSACCPIPAPDDGSPRTGIHPCTGVKGKVALR